jgi:transcriptional regulator with XRE-family HTH domain
MQDARVPKTPKRAGRTPKPGSRFISEVVADNLRAFRLLRRMNQNELAGAMRELGHQTWSRATVSEIERYGRSVTIEELVSAAVLLRIPPGRMLDPFMLPRGGGDWLSDIDFGGPVGIPAGLVAHWAAGELTVGVEPNGDLWLDADTPAAQEAATEAIKAQKASIEELGTDPPAQSQKGEE